MIKCTEVTYKDYGKVLRLNNDIVELIIPLQFGIRVMRYGLLGRDNLFCEAPDFTLQIGGSPWKLYGGHRLWHSPEASPRSYSFDDKPIEYRIQGDSVRLIQPEDDAKMQKELLIDLSSGSTEVNLTHSIKNNNIWPIEFSLWCLTVMAAGGVVIIPFYAKDTGLLHNRQLSVWPMTDMSDERLYLGEKYICIKQTNIDKGLKIGTNNTNGWAAYINNNMMFVKKFTHYENSVYPDNNVSFETYTCKFMTEIESLSPLEKVPPDGIIQHSEEWEIIDDIKLNNYKDEEELSKITERCIIGR